MVSSKTEANLDLAITGTPPIASGERRLLAKYLHNGILQDLTAAALHLQAAARNSSTSQAKVIEGVLASLQAGQRGVRLLVNALECEPTGPSTVILSAELERALPEFFRGNRSSVSPADARVTTAQANVLIELLTELRAMAGDGPERSPPGIEVAVGSIVHCDVAATLTTDIDLSAFQRRIRELGGTSELRSDRNGVSGSMSFPRDC